MQGMNVVRHRVQQETSLSLSLLWCSPDARSDRLSTAIRKDGVCLDFEIRLPLVLHLAGLNREPTPSQLMRQKLSGSAIDAYKGRYLTIPWTLHCPWSKHLPLIYSSCFLPAHELFSSTPRRLSSRFDSIIPVSEDHPVSGPADFAEKVYMSIALCYF